MMQKRISAAAFLFVFAVCTASLTGTAQAPAAKQPAAASTVEHSTAATKPLPANTLRITYGEKSEVWTTASLALANLDRTAVDVYNSHAKANQHYSGVALFTLLAHIGVPDKPHGKDFRLYLVAEGADGYQVVYSLGEVMPDVHDSTIIVATQ